MAWYWRSRIFKGEPGNTSVKCEANSPWKWRYNKAMQVIQSNNTQVKWLPREMSWWLAAWTKTPRRTAAKDGDSRSILQNSSDPDKRNLNRTIVGCSWNCKIYEGQLLKTATRDQYSKTVAIPIKWNSNRTIVGCSWNCKIYEGRLLKTTTRTKAQNLR